MKSTRLWVLAVVIAAGGALAGIEACVGDSPPPPADGGNDSSSTDAPSGDSGDGGITDSGPDTNPNCADAQGAFYNAVPFLMNGQGHGITFLAGSPDAVLVGYHASPGVLGVDAAIGPSNGQGDALAWRRTPNGDVVWATSFGGTLQDAWAGVVSDSAGDVYVAGNFKSSTFTIGSTPFTNPVSPNGYLPIIAKLSGKDGSVVWVHSITPSNAVSMCQQIALKNDHLVVGCTISTTTNVATPDGGTDVVTPLNGVNALIIHLDRTTGGAYWTTPLGSYAGDAGATASIDGLDVSAKGDVIASGTFSGPDLQDKPGGNATFTLTRTSPQRDGWVGEFSPLNGNAQWAKGFGGTTSASSVDAVISADDGAGGVLLEGEYQGQINLGTGPTTSNGSDDVFIASLKNQAGAPAWQKSFGGAGLDLAHGISIDDCLRPIAAVRVSDALTLDSVVLPAPQANSYAEVTMKLDATGKVLWANGPTPPSSAFLSITQVLCDPNNGRTFVTGFYGGTVDLGGGNTTTSNSVSPFYIAYTP